MNPCNLIDKWDGIKGTPAGLTELADMVNNQLQSWGFGSVNFSDKPPRDESEFEVPGEYVSDTNTVHMDPDFLATTDVEDVMSVALHESVHAMHDQGDLGSGSLLSDEYEAGFMGHFLSQEAMQKCMDRAASGWAPDDDFGFDGEGDWSLEYPFQSSPTSAGTKAHAAMK